MPPTHLARLIQAAMDEQNLSQGDVERRGGPSKQSLGRLINHWRGERSLDRETIPKLSKALGIAQRTLGRAAAVDMGLLPADEARDDALASLADALRERAGERDREVVVAAARAVWRILEQHADTDAEVLTLPARKTEPAKRAARQGINRGREKRAQLDREQETPPPLPDDEP